MKVEINIDETQFKDLLDGHLSKLSEDTIKNIIVESIHGYFSQNNYEQIENLFIETKNRYGYTEKCANPFLQRLVRDCDYSKLQDVLDAAINNLVENNDRILKDMFIEAIVDKMYNTYSFRDSVRRVLIEMNNYLNL